MLSWSGHKLRESAGVRAAHGSATGVPLASLPTGTVAWWAGPCPLSRPGPGTGTLPPLALGGAGGGALRWWTKYFPTT